MQDDRHHKRFQLGGVVWAILFLCVGFGAGFLVAVHTTVPETLGMTPDGEPAGVDFSPVWKAWDILNENFVPDAVATSSPIATTTAALNQQKVWGMISGLAASLNDPYTFFLPPQENTDFNSDISGSFGGVGLEVDVKNGILTVESPLKGTPAYNAGIESGDQILDIDGTTTTGVDVDTAVDMIRGAQGTQVTLTILRSGWSAPKDFKLTREPITIPVVETSARPDGIFVITLSEFTANSPDLFRDALRQFVESGDTKLILDLRGNPGGYLDAAVDIGSWFLPSGDTIVTENYDGHQANIVHKSYGYDIFNHNLQMVILVDKGTASASEILSDALRYYGVAKLVGTQTYGKGVVQELFPITDTTSLKVTVARWLGPDGLQIPHVGLTPNVEVDISDAQAAANYDPQMAKAVEMLGGNASTTAPTPEPVQ